MKNIPESAAAWKARGFFLIAEPRVVSLETEMARKNRPKQPLIGIYVKVFTARQVAGPASARKIGF